MPPSSPAPARPRHPECSRNHIRTESLEVDVAVFGRDDHGRESLPAIGEATWKARMGRAHPTRPERIRELLAARAGLDATHTRLLCFSGDGFTDDLRTAATDNPDLRLVDPERLYNGS
ncbi:hypothetical protein [Embleya scabrispora]|uniref:hypothetical protein n=1 Tax=Embleya scabrispora TaxID=159449 RepID=UPI000371503C|nr:hypothetical protein [Embleya scabrispora]